MVTDMTIKNIRMIYKAVLIYLLGKITHLPVTLIY